MRASVVFLCGVYFAVIWVLISPSFRGRAVLRDYVISGYLYPVSILYKSIAGRYRPVSVADGPITARYRFIKNASWALFFFFN